jgi:phospholipid/cholesterol/gamma-HCH transport system ATP-binding protein
MTAPRPDPTAQAATVPEAVVLSGVSKQLGHVPILEGISLCVPAGTHLGLIGPGASGKSVLLKILCGLVRPDSGSVQLSGRDITPLRESELMAVRKGIGMLFQNHALFDFMTVAENVAFPLQQLGVAPAEVAARVNERLRKVGMAGSETKMPAELSGGMKKRVGIARATITRPSLVLYDEPTAGLDPVTASKIYDLIRADQEETGCTTILVSAEVEALIRESDAIAMLYRGRLVHHGPAAAIMDAGDPLVRQFVRGDLEGPL